MMQKGPGQYLIQFSKASELITVENSQIELKNHFVSVVQSGSLAENAGSLEEVRRAVEFPKSPADAYPSLLSRVLVLRRNRTKLNLLLINMMTVL